MRILRRTARVRGFDVSWPEVDRVEVIATEGVAGYWSWGLDGGRRRAAGTLTVLRLYPGDPDRFGAAHPTPASTSSGVVMQRAIAGPFGLAFAMTDYPRRELTAALTRYTGPRFGGLLDETTRARRRAR